MAHSKDEQAAEQAVTEPEWRQPCNTLSDVRAHIDRLDALIAPLMAQRLHYVQTAANFKPSKEAVIVQSRVEEIVQTVRGFAEKYGASPDAIERVYRAMIDEFTRQEQMNWDKVHK
ncbi:MAG: chorismate mutase [Rhodospirillaceae bacterium]|nr:chorismate mutase [Rhodospirillaceae bacterium]